MRKFQLTLKVFIPLTITFIVIIATLFTINYYTEIIKKEVYSAADKKVKDLFQKDKLTYIRLIQLGSYLELGQLLQLNFQNEDIIHQVEIKSEDDVLANFNKYDSTELAKLSTLTFPLNEHGQNWGIISASIDLTSFNHETKVRINDLYKNGFIILISALSFSLLLTIFISKELEKISFTIKQKISAMESVVTMKDLEKQMTTHKTTSSFIKEINYINKIFTDFMELIRKTNFRLHKLEEEAHISRIAQDLSHDLHSPLAALDLIVDSLEGEKAEVVKLASERIKEIVSDLDRERLSRITTLINAKEIINKCLSLKVKEFSSIVFETSALEDVLILFNEDKLQRIISNLINNAIEAGASKITLSTKSNDNLAFISLKDNGQGIPEHLINTIFTRGFTYGKSNGSGLGLTQANDEVSSAGGELQILSELGRGTEISIILPLAF